MNKVILEFWSSDAVSVDSDAAMLLENLKSINYTNSNQWDGLVNDDVLAVLRVYINIFISKLFVTETLLLFKKLAKMHALFIAMRRVQPQQFYSKVDPHLHYKKFSPNFLDTIKFKITDVSCFFFSIYCLFLV